MLASHQLIGLASDWWDAYVEAHEESESINWNEFKILSDLITYLKVLSTSRKRNFRI
jgi:hypothetical protein